MLKECIIIGGGVAGLSAGIRLAELGVYPLILESGVYPAHRLCGEFFSPESLPILENWGISFSQHIATGRFLAGEKTIAFDFPHKAGSMSRYNFDAMLLNKARECGCEVITETSVAEIVEAKETKEDLYDVVLENGHIFKSKHLMIGTGKLGGNKLPMVYHGFKAHFTGISLDEVIEMHCFEGGYVGISPISPSGVNVACIVKKECVDDSATFMSRLSQWKGMERFRDRLKPGKMVFDTWMTGQLPEFGIREHENRRNIFWIGDAAGAIPPICGDGLGMAVTTGVMAAEYYAEKDSVQFIRDWKRRYAKRIKIGKGLHLLATTPWTYSGMAFACRWFPSLPIKLFSATRE